MSFSFIGLYLLAGFAFFLGLLYWAIIIDILLSWLTLIGVQIIIGPLMNITHPLYDLTRKILPTRVGMLDLAPLILILALDLMKHGIIPFIAQLIQAS
jgi:YggT family protein